MVEVTEPVSNVSVCSVSGRGLVCECSGVSACPDGAANSTCVTQPGGYCFVAVEEVLEDNGSVGLERMAGCLPPDEAGFMQVRARSFLYGTTYVDTYYTHLFFIRSFAYHIYR